VWKRFRPDRQRSLLRDELERLRQRRQTGGTEWAWALWDVSFGLEPGDAFALVGSNGSGKSTMLKILTRVMYPYAGDVSIGGRVGALIEVAGGIHPDLTGRENCYLYGSLLGLSRTDVGRRFDDIVAFAELESGIDRQVKFYSSGMKMRLGFGIAAYLEPDVLLVDEVLAVGDAQFQQRCLNRMREVLASGTTLVYVSHDLPTVESVCTHGLWLRHGETVTTGPIDTVLADYREWIEAQADAHVSSAPVRVTDATVTGADGPARTGEPTEIRIVLEADFAYDGQLHLGITQGTATPIITAEHRAGLRAGRNELRCRLHDLPLGRGRYALWCAALADTGDDPMPWRPATMFDVEGPDLPPTPRGVVRLAPVYSNATWDVEPTE
jgi:ABC-type polysaccharide/polyol phosphate transport system ATPase subunit